jgi:hypothetical protein
MPTASELMFVSYSSDNENYPDWVLRWNIVKDYFVGVLGTTSARDNQEIDLGVMVTANFIPEAPPEAQNDSYEWLFVQDNDEFYLVIDTEERFQVPSGPLELQQSRRAFIDWLGKIFISHQPGVTYDDWALVEEANHWNNVEEEMNFESWWPEWSDTETMLVSESVLSELDEDPFEEWTDDDDESTHVKEAREALIRNYVESLEHVDHGTIAAEDLRCPICRLEFGETDEFEELYEPLALPNDPLEAETIMMLRELPFDVRRPNNNAVVLPC